MDVSYKLLFFFKKCQFLGIVSLTHFASISYTLVGEFAGARLRDFVRGNNRRGRLFRDCSFRDYSKRVRWPGISNRNFRIEPFVSVSFAPYLEAADVFWFTPCAWSVMGGISAFLFLRSLV